MLRRITTVVGFVLIVTRLVLVITGVVVLSIELDREMLDMFDVSLNLVHLISLMVVFYPQPQLNSLICIDDLELNLSLLVIV